MPNEAGENRFPTATTQTRKNGEFTIPGLGKLSQIQSVAALLRSRCGGDRVGWVQMSKRDLQRIEVLAEIQAGRRTTESTAGVLGVSVRQVQRLLARYGAGGGAALVHRSRGWPASNRLSEGEREYVLELVRQNYRDFRPTLAAEVLLSQHGVEVSRETLRNVDG